MPARLTFLPACLLVLAPLSALRAAEPLLGSWMTANSGQYARIRATNGATPVSVWTGQTLPVYADLQQIDYSATFVYVRASGLGSHVMGPWYANAAQTQEFMNKPNNQNRIVRIPRTPQVAPTKVNTGLGVMGVYVNGSGVYNMLDAFSYSSTTGADAGMGGGGGVWNRDALIGEAVTFDRNNAHQPGNGDYHAHVNPLALRSQLNDHVTFDASSGVYTESAAAPAHSPILGWSFDGYPIYGPYGYSDPMNAGSTVARLNSGYVKRNGQFGTTNLASTGRTTLPLWAQIAQNRTTLTTAQDGPVTTKPADTQGISYDIGRYAEDWDFLGDLPPASTVGASWDLDRYNGRNCVTPEFPGGTYAYFTTITSLGTPAFPYLIGRQYNGVVAGGRVTSISETVTNYFTGGKNSTLTLHPPVVAAGAADVTLIWSSVEGGTYVLASSNDLQAFSNAAPVTATGVITQATDTGGGLNATRFYKVTRTAIANSSN